MKKRIALVLFSVSLFLASLGGSNVQAVESELIALATVNIEKSQITSQAKNLIGISFNLSNREKAQSDVKYSIALIEQTENKKNIIDERVYDETLSLIENQNISKEITYVAPIYLNGKYSLTLFVKNSSGLILAIAPIGEIALEGNGEYLQIDNASCYLEIAGDEKKEKYNLS